MLGTFQNKLHETTGRTIYTRATIHVLQFTLEPLLMSFVSFFAVAARFISLMA